MSKIILTKINAGFLAIVLIVGTFAISSPLTVYGQQYEQDYQQDDYESSYYPSDPRMDDKSKSAKQFQKANCDNENINVNGIDQSQAQRQLIDNTLGGGADDGITGQSAEEALDAITGNGEPLVNIDRNILNICFNDNDNTLTGLFSANQGQTGVIPPEPEPTTAILKVTKQINCEDATEGDCEDLLELVNENDFIFQVEGNNPDPSSPFPGSPTGTDVTLGPGGYVVLETDGETLDEDLQTFVENHPDSAILRTSPTFTGDCTQTNLFEATGTIAAGDSQTCNVINAFSILSIGPLP